MGQDVDPSTFKQPAVPNFAYVGRITLRALTKFRRLPDQPHHVGVGKAVHRTVNIFVRVGFQVMISMVPYPGDGITRKHHCGAGCQDKLEPFRHFKAAVCQITMQIKRRANPAPEKQRDNDEQIKWMEARQESNNSE